jgi:hypothetical protein
MNARPDAAQALRYALLSLIGLCAIGLGDVILRYTYSLYLSFEPTGFLQGGSYLLAAAAVFAMLGAWVDRPQNTNQLTARAARALLLALLLVALFQVFRQSLATALPLPGWAKALAMVGCVAVATGLAWRMSPASAYRLGDAAGLAMLTLFLLQPGMGSYLVGAFSPVRQEAVPAPQQIVPPTRRSIVIIFDEWDMEISEQSGLFERPDMRELLAQSFFARNALPAGSNTLESIPSMLIGQPFGEIADGSTARLRSKSGQEWTPQTAQLFSDLQTSNISHAVVGYYHDYCALITTARHCHAEPVQFFQGWEAQFKRIFSRSGQFDFPYSVFQRQWQATYQRLQQEALRAVEDRSNAMVWVHINVPHPPSAIAQGTHRDLRSDYLANLQLTADLITAVRARLQAQGDEATLVLTSDHWLRERELWSAMYEQQRGPGTGSAGKTTDLRVPLIIWFSKDATPVQHPAVTSTIAMRRLVPALLEGRLTNPQEVAGFFAQQPTPSAPRLDGTRVH